MPRCPIGSYWHEDDSELTPPMFTPIKKIVVAVLGRRLWPVEFQGGVPLFLRRVLLDGPYRRGFYYGRGGEGYGGRSSGAGG